MEDLIKGELDWHNKVNENFHEIDSQMAEKANKTDLDVTNENIGDKSQLNTNDKSNIVKAVNEVKTQANTTGTDLQVTNNTVSNLQTQVTNMASGSPKGTYNTLTELQTAYPTGTTGIFIIINDSDTAKNGHWFYWNGSEWTDGGNYQSAGIGDKTITPEKTTFMSKKNLFNKDTITVGSYVQQQSGNLSELEGYNASDFIPIKPSTLYTIKTSGTIEQIALYDESKEYVGGIATPNNTFTSFTTAHYVRLSIKDEQLDNFMLVEGNYIGEYVSYGYFFNKDLIPKLDYLKNVPETYVQKTQTSNLFNKDTVTQDKFVQFQSGNLANNTAYVASDFIPIKPNTNYRLTAGIGDLQQFAFYDYNKQYLWGVGVPNATGKIKSPEDGLFVRLSVLKTQLDNFMFGEDGYNTYVPYGDFIDKNIVPDIREISDIGQIVDFSDVDKYTAVDATGTHLCTPNIESTNDNNIIKTLGVYVENSGTYKFCVATIDQNELVVSPLYFTLQCHAGFNLLNLESQNIKVPTGYRVFMDLSSTNKLYNPTDLALKTVDNLIQDEEHVITGDYNGMIMYSTDKMIPFGYVLVEQDTNTRISNIEEQISTSRESITADTYIVRPDSVKLRLIADTSSNLSAVSAIPSKVFILGNSLTYGMCASDALHEYCYLLKEYFTALNPNVEVTRYSSAGWEGLTTSADRQNWWNTIGNGLFDADTDLVIIQYGDNVNTKEKMATFKEDAITLIKNIRAKCPNVQLCWVMGWFVSTEQIAIIKDVCKKTNINFANITQYKDNAIYKGTLGMTRTDSTNTIGETNPGAMHTVTDSGEARHPGDLGMEKISETIINTLNIQ
ncbi:SGNH/GDSL hydrolase family protein [Clostridium tyrobutyricum]|uniref:SGNH/GDSL hydrolase family protein n=1 Tax=Clostridium tyrobutyricum TaxID=1519 RepID=UPI0011CC5331|nr:hypothetical protein [Clostridium tyrobutyricum]